MDQDGRFARLGDLKKGEFIRRKATANKTYIKGEYINSGIAEYGYRKYSCLDADDISREILLKPDHMVWVGFTY